MKNLKILITIVSIAVSLITNGQDKKPCNTTIYRIADELPELIPPVEQITGELGTKINLPDSLLNRSETMLIEYVINCEGYAVRFKGLQTAESDGTLIVNHFKFLLPAITDVLRHQLKYKPARREGKEVDFIKIIGIKFNKGEIQIGGVE